MCQVPGDSPVPSWAEEGGLFCVTRSTDELTIVCEEHACEEHLAPLGLRVELGWVALRLEGPFPFSMTGVLASFLQPLAEGEIPIFAVSTFDTDYVLIKRTDLMRAQKALDAAGHQEGRS